MQDSFRFWGVKSQAAKRRFFAACFRASLFPVHRKKGRCFLALPPPFVPVGAKDRMRNINSEIKEDAMGGHEAEEKHSKAVGGMNRGKPFRLNEKQIEKFLAAHSKSGCTEDTIRQYRAAILHFRDFLPKSGAVARNSLAQWQTALLEQGYSARTVYTRVSAVNALLEYLGRRDYQNHFKMERPEPDLPDLTRDEYIRLLTEAQRQENITLYLLVKIFAVTGLSIQCLNDLTREAVDCGEIRTERKLYRQTVKIPAMLRRELLDYAMREGVRSGPLFRSKAGGPFNRSVITNMISRLGADAGLADGKANPRCLKRLYQNTLAAYQRQADEWIEANYVRLLEEEETQAGWMAGRG